MATALFSPAELAYAQVPLASTSALALRADARPPLAYRDLVLEPDTAHSTVGSATLRLGPPSAYSHVSAAVRAEIDALDPAAPADRVVVAVECAPTALASLRPDFALHLSSLLSTVFSRSSLPAELVAQLVVLPDAKAWTLHLDVLVLSADAGNVLDLALLAARSALALTRLPRTHAVGYDDAAAAAPDAAGFAGLVKGGKAGVNAVDFELVDGGWEDGDRLAGWEKLPIGLTLNLIDQLPYLDATLLEEAASPSQIVACFTSAGDLCGLAQLGEGEIELARVMPLLSEAKRCALDLMRVLNAKLRDA